MNRELILAIISGIFWTVGLFFPERVINSELPIKNIFYLLSIIFGGFYTTLEAWEELKVKKITIDFLMLFAAAGALFLNKYNDAALLLFLFSLGHALEHYALEKAQRSITNILQLVSHTAILSKNGILKEVQLDTINLNDCVYIKPNSKVSVDGIVIKGISHINQAPITGESIPVKKEPSSMPDILTFNQTADKHKVYAGTINGNEGIEVIVAHKSENSTLARLIKLIQDAEAQKSPTQLLADTFEKYYVPSVIIIVLLLMSTFLFINESFQESFYRAMSVLIAASPCALAISTPSAILAGISRAAKNGVIIKGGKPLEDLGEIGAIAFDKTGTLTEGKPKLKKIIPFEPITKEKLVKMIYAVEQGSDHPLAVAITNGINEKYPNIETQRANNIEAIIGGGVRAIYEGSPIFIGNKRSAESFSKSTIPFNISKKLKSLQEEGQTAMLVYFQNAYSGIISVMDTPRKEAIGAIQSTKRMVKKLSLLSGDNQNVVDAIAFITGIEDARGNMLPEDKVQAIEQLKVTYNKVAMIGDGVNDAPAMARSDVSISMRAIGSDVALETADIALMSNNLNNIPFTIKLSQQTRKIIKQNIWISMGMVCILVPLTLLGVAAIGPTVIAHEGSTILVVLNALRLLRFKDIN